MNITLGHPSELQWFETELPDVHDVPEHCAILAWFVNDFGSEDSNEWQGKLRRIEVIQPGLNPTKWCDSIRMPIGYSERVKYWAWISHPTLIGKVLS